MYRQLFGLMFLNRTRTEFLRLGGPGVSLLCAAVALLAGSTMVMAGGKTRTPTIFQFE